MIDCLCVYLTRYLASNLLVPTSVPGIGVAFEYSKIQTDEPLFGRRIRIVALTRHHVAVLAPKSMNKARDRVHHHLACLALIRRYANSDLGEAHSNATVPLQFLRRESRPRLSARLTPLRTERTTSKSIDTAQFQVAQNPVVHLTRSLLSVLPL